MSPLLCRRPRVGEGLLKLLPVPIDQLTQISLTHIFSFEEYYPDTAAITMTERFSSLTALRAASPPYPLTHDKITSPQDTQNFIDNEFTASTATEWIDIHDPATNNVVTRVPQSTDDELKAAVASAQKAFPAWRATSLLKRQQIMFNFTALVRQNWDRLAANITLEQGKTCTCWPICCCLLAFSCVDKKLTCCIAA